MRDTTRISIILFVLCSLTFGPPLEMRLAPEEISELATRAGFGTNGYVDLGYNYLVRYEPDDSYGRQEGVASD